MEGGHWGATFFIGGLAPRRTAPVMDRPTTEVAVVKRLLNKEL